MVSSRQSRRRPLPPTKHCGPPVLVWSGFLPGTISGGGPPGDWIADCVLVEPNQWWIGVPSGPLGASRWPGGVLWLDLPDEMVTRAWLKMEEALRWAALPVAVGTAVRGDGQSPGGASQALLAQGLERRRHRSGRDRPAILAHSPLYAHHRRAFQPGAAAGVPQNPLALGRHERRPRYTLEAVEATVTHPEVNIRGILVTFKPRSGRLATEVPAYLARIRGWGFNLVRGLASWPAITAKSALPPCGSSFTASRGGPVNRRGDGNEASLGPTRATPHSFLSTAALTIEIMTISPPLATFFPYLPNGRESAPRLQ